MAVLECKDLSKHYGNAPALNHVSLAVEPGRSVGLLEMCIRDRMRASAPADGLDLLLPSFARRDVSQVSISQKYSVSLSASYTAKVTFSEARSRRFCPSPASLWRSIRR